MNLNLPSLSRNDLRVRTVTGACWRNTESTFAGREECASSLRIRGGQNNSLSLHHKLGRTHSLKFSCLSVNSTRNGTVGLNLGFKKGTPRRGRRFMVRAVNTEEKQKEKEKESPNVEATTKKWGLEAGLWQIFTSKEEGSEGKEKKASQAKHLLTRYGGAYLATSIFLSLVSFSLCYVLVNSGVDVAALLQKVGIQTNEAGEKVGTFALAYAAHKAASPIRFPPTVALTPIVAGWFGKKPDSEEEKKP
ncbi:hypothetical protein R1flu_021911 [Riccia fluitans]|uniref:DUF1279 domain-containing protein n=1 Tax=Riccia fluitans TaxID=41844 RepID=A0ABD1ZQR6_9MARC